MKLNKKKSIIFIVLIVIIAIFSVSMAYFREAIFGNRKYVIKASQVLLRLNETSSSISLGNVLPQKDEDGMNNDAYTFSLENLAGDITYRYSIYLVDDTIPDGYERVSDQFIKYYLTNDSLTTQNDPALVSTLTTDENGRILETGTIEKGDIYNYTLRFWIDYDATQEDVAGKVFSVKLNVLVEEVEKKVYADASGANMPELTSGMIPVTYNETDKTWVKADLYEEWYDYEKWNWANAVTVTEETRDYYMTMESGEPISMDDINTMWVWIPRYEYQYTDLSTSYAGGTKSQPGEIKINFISEDTLVPSDSNTYKIPEGFIFGEENISGFWMAKFETSTLESCIATDNSVNTDCDATTLTLQVKPNVTSWRGARVSTFFQASRLMQSSINANKYGFDAEGEGTMDVHMLKNTEWGIVAYLSQSKYGKYGNSSYTGANKEVYQNKSSSYLTGNSNGTPSTDTFNTQNSYDTPDTGYGASTTGTIYGVYDMSGGADEYVMGNFNKYSGHSSSQNSGFEGTNGPTDEFVSWPDGKYFDLYTSDTASNVYKLGDATYETSGWYSDYESFANSNYPWFNRGGYCGNDMVTGVFHYSDNSGMSYANYTSRLSIKP